MQPVDPPDSHHLNAALGWIDLGNTGEARADLARISPVHQTHPVVLEAWWQICAMERNWGEALDVSRRLVAALPDAPNGWINQSYSLHELRRTGEALDQLLPLVEKFSDLSTIPYNLACYTCQLGRLQEARNWLERAIKIRGKDSIKELALADTDLKPLWEHIRNL